MTGIELARQICAAMEWDMSRVLYFTDSTTVLWWLRTHRELDVFVGNRICKILDQSSVEQWFHVRTDQNPADIPTRGMSGKRLASCSLWWDGPEFFLKKRPEWPSQPEVVETRECREGYRKEEVRRLEKWFCTTRKDFCELDEFWSDIVLQHSNLSLGFRVAGRVFAWLGKFSRFSYSTTSKLAAKKMQLCVLRVAQEKGLGELKKHLEKGKKVDKEYQLLRPYLDSSGLIRVGGRLRDSVRLPLAVRCPILINGRQEYALRLLTHVHCNELRHCGGKRTLIAEIRYNIWVTRASVLAKKVLKDCVWCNRSMKQRPIKMAKAPLHFTRLPLAKGCAFSEIGLDMAGPFFVKHGRGRAIGKRYVLLFSCCWTRALSLEVVDSASAESCVYAFLRHANVFGFPLYVNSDRGSNLVGTERHLREQWGCGRG